MSFINFQVIVFQVLLIVFQVFFLKIIKGTLEILQIIK